MYNVVFCIVLWYVLLCYAHPNEILLCVLSSVSCMSLLWLPDEQTTSETDASCLSSSGSTTLSSSIFPHPLFSSSPPAAEHRYLFRNLSVEIMLHLGRSLSTHNYHGQSCRTALNSAGSLMTLLTARPVFFWRYSAPHLH